MRKEISRREFLKAGVAGLGALAVDGFSKDLLSGAEGLIESRVEPAPLFKLGVGSCLRNSSDAAALARVVAKAPDAFVWLGDNIYADTQDMALMRARYDTLKNNTHFKALWNLCPNFAIWDDHDYGSNNQGEEYSMKVQAQGIFLDFWQVPSGDPRRQRPGIYHSHLFGQGSQTIRLIQLDNRYFRTRRTWSNATVAPAGSTMLGSAQWTWLAAELAKPATVRIVTSGVEFLSTYRYQPTAQAEQWEGWDEFPEERKKLFNLIKDNKIPGVIFLSGDQHFSEVNKLDAVLGYPAHELCSSALDQSWELPTVNPARQGQATGSPNFGMVTVDWGPADPVIHLQILSAANGSAVADHAIKLSTLNPWGTVSARERAVRPARPGQGAMDRLIDHTLTGRRKADSERGRKSL